MQYGGCVASRINVFISETALCTYGHDLGLFMAKHVLSIVVFCSIQGRTSHPVIYNSDYLWINEKRINPIDIADFLIYSFN